MREPWLAGLLVPLVNSVSLRLPVGFAREPVAAPDGGRKTVFRVFSVSPAAAAGELIRYLEKPNAKKGLPMPASVSDPAQFKLLTQSIAYDMQTLSFHWKLYRDLRSAVEQYETELNESRTFWSLTFDAHRDASLFRICRLYDQHTSTLNLKNWLVALRDNPQFFSSQSTPCETTLATDIDSVSAADQTVNKIVRLRNNAIAHVAIKPIVAQQLKSENCNIPFADVDALVDRARDIVNRYTTLLKGESYSTTIVGHDDFRTVLESVRMSIAK